MSNQLALILPALQAELELVKRPIPKPGPGQLLVKIHSAGLNPLDWTMAGFGIFIKKFPQVLGSDYAGEVIEVGEGVSGWAKGDRLMHQYISGSFQQYAALPAEFSFKIPATLSYDVAGTMPTVLSTGFVGLFANSPIGLGLNPTFARNQPHEGKSALVLGGGSSVGRFVIQQLKFLGFSTIVAYASGRHTDYLKSLGATDIIDRTQSTFEQVSSRFAGQFGVIFDAVSRDGSLDASAACLRSGGVGIVFVLPIPAEFQERLKQEGKNFVLVSGHIYDLTPEHEAFGRLQVEHVPKLLEEGLIKGLSVEVLPGGLRGVAGGLERLRKGEVSGIKLVAHPQETTEA
ncbi:GroES-like protein [Cylindrobasidium torrendii FP15055 ss-10]|uniref:GroES-like protein n=1 Tax=Cylindrobasidium torrendii FP15055 ss-10 TaxID=1314674 RepID=A0A0D7BPY5_9AGAR|nr:GroES-like protein [Cylindrobasidium torrendii FP15055 ss-10]